MLEVIEFLEFVEGANFELIDLLQNSSTQFVSKFDVIIEMICNSKARIDFSTAGKHHGLRTVHNKHNLFHRIKFGRDVELQNIYKVSFISPREVMQVSMLSALLGVGSNLVGRHRDATPFRYGHLSFDLSLGVDDRLRFRIDTGSNHSNF